MAVGNYTPTKMELDNTVLGSAQSLRDIFANVKRVKSWLDGVSVQNLIDNQGYTDADANLLKSMFTDLNTLANIANGTSAQGTAAYNFFTFLTPSLGVH